MLSHIGVKTQSALSLEDKTRKCYHRSTGIFNLRRGLMMKYEKITANREENTNLLAELQTPMSQLHKNKQLMGMSNCLQTMINFNCWDIARCSKLIGRCIKINKKYPEIARATRLRGAGWPLDRSRSNVGTPLPGC
jgi:hypothetical protein